MNTPSQSFPSHSPNDCSYNRANGSEFCTSHIMCLIRFFLWTWIQIYSLFLIQRFFVSTSKSIINDSTILMAMKNAMNKEQCLRIFAKVFLFVQGTQSSTISALQYRLDCLLLWFSVVGNHTRFLDYIDATLLNSFVLWISRL